MKETFELLKEFYPWLASVSPFIMALLAALPILKKLGATGLKRWQQRRLLRDLHPFYTAQEIRYATQYYVETRCQNIAPSKEWEPGETHAFATKQASIPFFLKQAFKNDSDNCQYYIVLADSGMGKTTFLINLYLRYINQWFAPDYQIKLFPLGFPDIDKEIERIPKPEKRQTILLLDAFDEDGLALHDYKARLRELIQKTLFFREVVITCRTQFFPSEEEEPKETGVLRFGGNGGERIFRKLYLSPFDNQDVRMYIQKRFRWYQRAAKSRARQIVAQSPSLMVRPMLLSYIDDLLHSDQAYTAPFQVYAELIQKWIEREAQKVPSARKAQYEENLFDFSRTVACYIYEQREHQRRPLTISGDLFAHLAREYHIQLNPVEMKSRSLLNRNALGEYKFSHKSILEYFLAEEAFFNADFRHTSNFDGMDQAGAFLKQLVVHKLTLPYLQQPGIKVRYRSTDPRFQNLRLLPEKSLLALLPHITELKVLTWELLDDGLLFTGLPKLQRLEFIGNLPVSEVQAALAREIPGCRVETRSVTLRHPALVADEDSWEEFGLTPEKFANDLTVGRPRIFIQNEYEVQEEVVVDHVTGLTWERAGSQQELTFQEAHAYVAERNHQKFAGYDNWRLPTIPELLSLLEPERQGQNLYLTPEFEVPEDAKYPWYWSADRRSGSPDAAWDVYFIAGGVYWNSLAEKDYARCVRRKLQE